MLVELSDATPHPALRIQYHSTIIKWAYACMLVMSDRAEMRIYKHL